MLNLDLSVYHPQLRALLTTFADSPSTEDPCFEEEALRDLIIDILCLLSDHDRTDQKLRSVLWEQARTEIQSFDPDEPELTQSAKLLRLLGRSNTGATLHYAEKLMLSQQLEEQKRQSARARTPRKIDALNAAIEQWIRVEPGLSTTAIEHRLPELKGTIIEDIDEDTICYYPQPNAPSKEISVKGLAPRVSRLRKKAQT